MTTLAELRQANLQEQKKQEETPNGHAPAGEAGADQHASPASQEAAKPAQPTLEAVAAATKAAAEPAPPANAERRNAPHSPVSPAAGRRRPGMASMKESDKEALVDILPAISKAVVSLAAQAAVNEGEPEKSAAFLNRIRGSLNHKVLYPSGVKTTVDMSPALFHRAKKYCLDHGNVTLRQLFLDLLTEFLAEEGY